MVTSWVFNDWSLSSVILGLNPWQRVGHTDGPAKYGAKTECQLDPKTIYLEKSPFYPFNHFITKQKLLYHWNEGLVDNCICMT